MPQDKLRRMPHAHAKMKAKIKLWEKYGLVEKKIKKLLLAPKQTMAPKEVWLQGKFGPKGRKGPK